MPYFLPHQEFCYQEFHYELHQGCFEMNLDCSENLHWKQEIEHNYDRDYNRWSQGYYRSGKDLGLILAVLDLISRDINALGAEQRY